MVFFSYTSTGALLVAKGFSPLFAEKRSLIDPSILSATAGLLKVSVLCRSSEAVNATDVVWRSLCQLVFLGGRSCGT